MCGGGVEEVMRRTEGERGRRGRERKEGGREGGKRVG